MKLCFEILADELSRQEPREAFEALTAQHLAMVVQDRCYLALEQFREILRDDSIEDEACFMRIERIVRVFESMGSRCGTRHDFG